MRVTQRAGVQELQLNSALCYSLITHTGTEVLKAFSSLNATPARRLFMTRIISECSSVRALTLAKLVGTNQLELS